MAVRLLSREARQSAIALAAECQTASVRSTQELRCLLDLFSGEQEGQVMV